MLVFPYHLKIVNNLGVRQLYVNLKLIRTERRKASSFVNHKGFLKQGPMCQKMPIGPEEDLLLVKGDG